MNIMRFLFPVSSFVNKVVMKVTINMFYVQVTVQL